MACLGWLTHGYTLCRAIILDTTIALNSTEVASLIAWIIAAITLFKSWNRPRFSGVAALFVRDLFAQHLIHKVALSCFAWLILGILLWGHWRLGWRGRIAARWTLSGFIFLGLAYFGSKFVLEIILGRHWG